jgi:arginine/lysine/ornithine decarboxylase
VDWDAWDEDHLRERIRTNPLVKDSQRANAERPFRLACIQRATYDGTIYNVRKVMEKIGRLCEYVLWDEAWIGYNAFHPLFRDHSPMRLEKLGPEMPGLFSTQSVHKQGRVLPSLANPQARRAYSRPAALHRAQAIQRVLPDQRLDVAILSAVRVTRRERQGS